MNKPTLNSKIVLNGIKKDLPQVKIIEAYQPTVIDCESKEDFNDIINSDIEKYKEMSTQRLNKTFKIPGYKITRVRGEICLRSIKPCERQDNLQIERLNEEIQNIKEAFNQLSEQFEIIKKMICGVCVENDNE